MKRLNPAPHSPSTDKRSHAFRAKHAFMGRPPTNGPKTKGAMRTALCRARKAKKMKEAEHKAEKYKCANEEERAKNEADIKALTELLEQAQKKNALQGVELEWLRIENEGLRIETTDIREAYDTLKTKTDAVLENKQMHINILQSNGLFKRLLLHIQDHAGELIGTLVRLYNEYKEKEKMDKEMTDEFGIGFSEFVRIMADESIDIRVEDHEIKVYPKGTKPDIPEEPPYDEIENAVNPEKDVNLDRSDDLSKMKNIFDIGAEMFCSVQDCPITQKLKLMCIKEQRNAAIL
ncbi:hypothetical protein QR680_006105 [Steinernema hermaphroditum]|uniref:Uncharacterized protein n=1 Tax=Steinernema hermaphroditum TaxID=289476 RepID=A0AA39LWU5_9BILA|nr:hypothetical protein QR680_006105 [Steinernema hermaphroditum]